MDCALEAYRARIGTWAARGSSGAASARTAGPWMGVVSVLTMCMLTSNVLTALLVISGIEQNPGPGVQEAVIKAFCAGCSKTLRWGSQCDSCGKWYHMSCSKIRAFEKSKKWTCAVCNKDAAERIHRLESELSAARRFIDDLKQENRNLREQLRRTNNAIKTVTEHKWTDETQCLVLGDSIVRHVCKNERDMVVECFPGIHADQLRRVIEKKNFHSPVSVILHVGTNDVRRNTGHVMGDIYDLITTTKRKFPGAEIILSGIIRRRDMSWQRIGKLNDKFQWVARSHQICFVDPNSWIYDGDLGRDGLHLNREGVRRLESLFSRIGLRDRGKQLPQKTP